MATVQLPGNGCEAGSIGSLAKPTEKSSLSSSCSLASPSSSPRSSSFPCSSCDCRSSSSSSSCSSSPSSASFLVYGQVSNSVSSRFGFPFRAGVPGKLLFVARATFSSLEQQSLGKRLSRRSVQAKSSRNGATNAVPSSFSMANVGPTELGGIEEEMVEEPSVDEANGPTSDSDGFSVTAAPSCSLPDFSMTGDSVTLLNPLKWLPSSSRNDNEDQRPLLLYVPGMDGTGQGIRSQLSYLCEAGYDIRCVYIPSSDRSSWQQLVQKVLLLVKEEVCGVNGVNRHLTVFGESFGGGLALRLAAAAPSLVTRLVILNAATNFPSSNPLGSLAASTKLLALFPEPLYQIAQDILLPFMVKRNRVSIAGTEDFLSPVDFVNAACAAWRLSLLNDKSGLEEEYLKSVTMPTLVIASAKDRIIKSLAEGARLQALLPTAKRVVLPESGHTALFEDKINIVDIMHANGFPHPPQMSFLSLSTTNITPPNPVAKREEAVADSVMDEMGMILEPWRTLTSPLISGTENLPMPSSEPRRPLLFVGNHTMFGVYDSPILVYELYLRGFRCRGLAHPGHWLTGIGGIFERYGNVKATKRAAYRLLKEGENVLLFPGGAREVCKLKGEEYKLLWRETADFVRMASRHKAIIVPFGALGADEAYDILFDGREVRASLIGPLLEEAYNRVGIDPEYIYPVTTFPGTKFPSPFPVPSKIERIYFHFAEPIDTLCYANYINDRGQVQALYEKVKKRVEDSIELLKVIQENDPERELSVRLLAKLGRLLPEFLPRMPDTKVKLPNGLSTACTDTKLHTRFI